MRANLVGGASRTEPRPGTVRGMRLSSIPTAAVMPSIPGPVATPFGASPALAPPDVAGIMSSVNNGMYDYPRTDRSFVIQASLRGNRTGADVASIVSAVNNAMYDYARADRVRVIGAGVSGPYSGADIASTISSVNNSMYDYPRTDRTNTIVATIGPRDHCGSSDGAPAPSSGPA